MKVLHTIPSLDLNSGGPSQSVYQLTKSLRNIRVDSQILTYKSSDTSVRTISDAHYIHSIQLSKFNVIQYSKKFLEYLASNSAFDIYHGHGLWQMPVHQMSRYARKIHIPYVISPRGMLEPWSLEQGKIKKKIALRLYQFNDLSKTACIHATGNIEAKNIHKLGFKNPIAVIPNGIDLSELFIKDKEEVKFKNTILFLSRIHPKKGIELLIEAWTKIEKPIRKDWVIKIAGNGNEKYIVHLDKLISESKLENEIEIIGPKFGEEKITVYRQADIFVLPTYSENFGIVVAEALACGVPVITTKGAPWEELNTLNAGWWIDIGVEPLANALNEAMQLSDNERRKMGLNGRKLVEENYSIESVAQKMIQLYEWILYKKEKPEFIYE
jgi:glycosyltransferase involved in cell wall biosynthesis